MNEVPPLYYSCFQLDGCNGNVMRDALCIVECATQYFVDGRYLIGFFHLNSIGVVALLLKWVTQNFPTNGNFLMNVI